ncbi:Putative transcriptional regulator, LysR family [Cupriavidus taiwanensis]|nr:Putative transcriptional regulator, LysR family [Cupriavidus taiwanensis]SOY51956.1 Putative transcriptional regulator, LysR family [Cupriavidus taiwanensis]SOY84379.1 Putative transcriptional regulator, LysR family [Cupriavidus taiwanensis]SOZ24286.1 Putative transcriptional regulator, LysR family [Cupriavidus taiwanensis]SOZ58997.1 Putative transcriptional regulator, LysR family [Cupriavidus taiwanensis]
MPNLSNMNVSLRQLRAFIAVAQERHFTRAAEKLDLSQSSVSALIHELEANLGLKLFDRHTRQLHITQAGAELLPLVKKAVADIDSVIENSSELRTLGRGRVSIAASSIQAALMLPRVIREFCVSHPGVKVELHDVSEHEVTRMVSSGEVDFGIGTIPEGQPDLSAHRLMDDAFVIVMPAHHPLRRRKTLRWEDVAGLPVIGPHKGNPIRDCLDTALAARGITLQRVHEVFLPLTMVGMVDAGLGIAVMSAAVTRLTGALGLATVMPTDPVIHREISLLVHADRSLSPPAQAFRDLLMRYRARLAEAV